MIQCNRGCGATNLHWKIVDTKYKLFQNNDLIHMCNDGVKSNKAEAKRVTDSIVKELGLTSPSEIPVAEPYVPKNGKFEIKEEVIEKLLDLPTTQPEKMFTISTTANGIAMTGDDKHNAIYLPKIALPELVKALMDFI